MEIGSNTDAECTMAGIIHPPHHTPTAFFHLANLLTQPLLQSGYKSWQNFVLRLFSLLITCPMLKLQSAGLLTAGAGSAIYRKGGNFPGAERITQFCWPCFSGVPDVGPRLAHGGPHLREAVVHHLHEHHHLLGVSAAPAHGPGGQLRAHH
eukprot:scaffold47256_cov20-Prasinocladus_malaysianus.AAC.1